MPTCVFIAECRGPVTARTDCFVHSQDRFAGGASGGAAAAVSAGIVPVAFGVDSDGGVRVPAGLCGVVSLKPTFGRIKEKSAMTWTTGEVQNTLPALPTQLDFLLAAPLAGPCMLRPPADSWWRACAS